MMKINFGDSNVNSCKERITPRNKLIYLILTIKRKSKQ